MNRSAAKSQPLILHPVERRPVKFIPLKYKRALRKALISNTNCYHSVANGLEKMEIGTEPAVKELTRGRELARQLQLHIDSGFPVETCRSLTAEIMSAFDNGILMVTSAGTVAENNTQLVDGSESQRAESHGRAFEVQQHRAMCKKRKVMPKWTSQVRLGSGPGAEGPVDDGYSWRKYGQKVILGAKYQRGYYRCTHRDSQGCAAMKLVQRCEDNPLVFDVTYRGTHTCQRKPYAHRGGPQHQNQQERLLSFQTSLKVKTEGLDSKPSTDPSPSSLPFSSPSSLPFSFPSTPVDSPLAVDNGFVGGFSSPFVSPATSESNYFSMSPCQMSSYGGQNLHAAESDFAEIVSAANSSVTNLPFLDMDLLLDSVDLDQEFPFDACSFLS